ncbi:uncharacterized protein BJ212DRAFT_1487158 [Suillus subaureus]|uniref:Uncharacterized protein n=1 Tax=Suillus subaureus TaxID=48587 RepID=A0A9P7DTZ0_9AGAM|nr:uncharacterized protein BJ212DRAFT_1487158 [Suillus subaureus]KAG1803114.1 hypothetical protein BJ212DRAFT_1487158 [Suillus subaureus]
MLNLKFWTNTPACHLLKQHILQVTQPKPLATQIEALQDSDWIDDLFLESEQHPVLLKALPIDGSITEPESDELIPLPLKAATPLLSKTLPSDDSIMELESDNVTPLPSKALPSGDDSVTEPESDEPGQCTVPSKTLPSNDSITELELDKVAPQPLNIAPLPSKALPSDNDSVMEPESEPTTPKPIAPKLNWKWFATPSPPPPDSIYWKYFTQEEDAHMYDCSGTDKSFQAV